MQVGLWGLTAVMGVTLLQLLAWLVCRFRALPLPHGLTFPRPQVYIYIYYTRV